MQNLKALVLNYPQSSRMGQADLDIKGLTSTGLGSHVARRSWASVGEVGANVQMTCAR